MSEQRAHTLALTREELIALYILLARHEAELDERQREIQEEVSRQVYRLLSLDEIEDIEGYYQKL
jgi:hypothetical protein